MNEADLTIKTMYMYKRIGRVIYLILFSASLITTIVQGISRTPYFLGFIFIDVTIGLIGLWLEATLIHFSQLGTIYVETNRQTELRKLKAHHENKETYYVGEAREDYIVNIEGGTYTKNYKKSDTTLEENPDIQIPVVEIVTIEKISRASDNKYSLFAVVGEKSKTENVKIIVNNKAKEIQKV